MKLHIEASQNQVSHKDIDKTESGKAPCSKVQLLDAKDKT